MMQLPAEQEPGMIPTKNNTGFMFTELAKLSEQCIEEAAKHGQPVLEMACAYGVFALPLLEKTQCDLVAADLSQEHLDILWARLTPEQQKRTTLAQGKFPHDFNFAPNSFGAIHISNMLHFLTGKDIMVGLDKCLDWLQPGGKLYLTICSINFPLLEDFLPIYQKNRAEGHPWPGELYNLNDYIPEENRKYAPDNGFFHVFSTEDIAQCLQQAGFVDVDAHDFSIGNVIYQSDKGAWVGAIASKASK